MRWKPPIGSAPLQNRTALYDLRQFDNKTKYDPLRRRDGVIANPNRLVSIALKTHKVVSEISITGSCQIKTSIQLLPFISDNAVRIARSYSNRELMPVPLIYQEAH